jgi:hypothetical protein
MKSYRKDNLLNVLRIKSNSYCWSLIEVKSMNNYWLPLSQSFLEMPFSSFIVVTSFWIFNKWIVLFLEFVMFFTEARWVWVSTLSENSKIQESVMNWNCSFNFNVNKSFSSKDMSNEQVPSDVECCNITWALSIWFFFVSETFDSLISSSDTTIPWDFCKKVWIFELRYQKWNDFNLRITSFWSFRQYIW